MTVSETITSLLARQRLISATLSDNRTRQSDSPRKVLIKPIRLKGESKYQFEAHRAGKVFHRNLSPKEAQTEIIQLLTETFQHGQIYTKDADVEIRIAKTGQVRVQTQPPSKAPAPPVHNRTKNYILPEGQPCDFLVRLGVMTASGQVIAAKHDKFKQINRFLEMVADVESALPKRDPLRIIDFGSGKSYLTFALYYYLHVLKKRPVQIVGLDLKQDVIEGCARIAQDLGYDGLTFAVGDIQSYAGWDEVDMMVSLHACDTATDDALAKAVAWNAQVILAVPCCQHELFRQIENPAMAPLLKHGILKERLAALVTDSLRASLLEQSGYNVQVMEFIDLEHTPKNLLIRAVRQRSSPPKQALTPDYIAFRDFWSAHPTLEKDLGAGE